MNDKKLKENHSTLCDGAVEPHNTTDASVEANGQEMCVKTAITRSEPIMQFESQEQLDASLKEWQAFIGLRDWIIAAKVTDDFQLVGTHGECVYNRVSRLASIHIKPYDKLPHNQWMAKQPQEQVLIHELLHCVIFSCEEGSHTVELEHYNIYLHQLIDQMATALIMAKYGLTLEWFRA